jgi:hypothetical protein
MSKKQRNPKGPFKADFPPPLTAYAKVGLDLKRCRFSNCIIIRLPNTCIQVNIGDDDECDYQYQYTYPTPEICKRCDFCTGNDEQEYVTFSVPENIYGMLEHYREIHRKICDLHDELKEKCDDGDVDNNKYTEIRQRYFNARNEKYRLREELDVIFTLPELPKLQ